MSITRQNIIEQLKTIPKNGKLKDKNKIIKYYKKKLTPYLEEQKKLGNLISDTITYKTIDAQGHIVIQKRKIDEVKGVLEDIKTYLETLKVI